MLSGCRVLELCDATGVLAGRILADLGADVVKIEPPSGRCRTLGAPKLVPPTHVCQLLKSMAYWLMPQMPV